MRDLVYYVAISLDGFIAAPDGDTSMFPTHPDTLAALFERYPETCPTQARGPLGVTGAPRRFDTVLLGARTHAPAVAAGLPEGAYPHLRQVVVTHDRTPVAGCEVLSGDVAATVADLKAHAGRDIWLCGGGQLAAQLIEQIDEIQLKVNPVVLGSGIPFLGGRRPAGPLRLTEVAPLPHGVVLTTYRTSGR